MAVKKCVKFEDSNRAIPRNLQAVPLYWLHTILKILSNTWKFVTFYDEKVKQNFKPRTLNLYTQTYFRTPVCLKVGGAEIRTFYYFLTNHRTLQGPSWQSGYFRLALTGRNMQIRFCFGIFRLDIFRHYIQPVFVKCLPCALYWTTCKSPSFSFDFCSIFAYFYPSEPF